MLTAQEAPPLPLDSIPELLFSQQGGFYPEALQLTLSAPGGQVYLTTNGRDPQPRSADLYRRPLTLRRSTVVKALAVRNGVRGPIVAHTYLIDEPATSFPVVSIAAPPELLFDPDRGIFVSGPAAEYDSTYLQLSSNFWTRREYAINTEIFEPDGRCVFRSRNGLRVFGGVSRTFPQKSMVLVARERYGESRFDHPIFGKEGPKDPKFLVLRNSGSDFGKSHFRDAYMTSLVEGWDLDVQASRPAHVYINGTYWGIYNIREKINRYYLRDHDRVGDKDSVDLLEHRYVLKRGSRRHYAEMLKWLRGADLSVPANYAYLQSLMEVDNFMDLQIAQIFFDNRDAGGNIKFYRPQTEDGRWRWILFDTDWGFGMHGSSNYKRRSLSFFTTPDGPDWPNPPWSTFLLRKLLENPDFRRRFVVRFRDRLNTSFHPEHTRRQLEAFIDRYRPEMPRQFDRWHLSRKFHERHLERMRAFAERRPEYINEEVQEFFAAGALKHLRVGSSYGGYVVLNDHLEVRPDEPFAGDYFERYPLRIRAVPRLGYRFAGWSDRRYADDDMEFSFELYRDTTTLYAVFEKYEHPLVGELLLNELSVNNRESGDWVELYNYTEEPVDLTGWRLTDLKHEFVFPHTVVPARDYVVVCRDSSRFKQVHPTAYRILGGMQFGLNKRHEILSLYSNDGAVVDSVSYRLEPTDTAFTWNLLLPHLDNGDPENWELLRGNGSPLAANPYYVTSSLQARRDAWLQSGLAITVLLLAGLALWWKHGFRRF